MIFVYDHAAPSGCAVVKAEGPDPVRAVLDGLSSTEQRYLLITLSVAVGREKWFDAVRSVLVDRVGGAS